MPLVTLTSDYGVGSTYAALLHGALYSALPEVRVIDVTHAVRRFDVVEAALLMGQMLHHFPVGSVHLCGVRAAAKDRVLRAVRFDGRWVLATDTGFFRLMEYGEPESVVDLTVTGSPAFPELDVFVPAAIHLLRGDHPAGIGTVGGELYHAESRRPTWEAGALVGHVAHIDGYGNCITNIHRRDFEGAGTGRPFVIRQRMVRMEIRKIHTSYEDVSPGERVALFNRAGYLEIAINSHSVPGGKGGADSLLGLSHGTPVRVEFEG